MKKQFKERRFEYIGTPVLTRGGYGESVEVGFNTPHDPDAIFVFDATFGEFCWISIETGVKSGDWIEV